MTAAAPPTAPLAAGSVSLRLYPPRLADPAAVLDELTAQAVLAVEHGFDGVLLSERHGGAWGQIPNPLQVAGFLLAAMPRGWVAPCPLLLPFRNPAVVAEELSWLDARFPGRVGAGFGSGGNAPDFAAMDVPFDERAARFDAALRTVAAILGGAPHALDRDVAVARVRAGGLPLVSAAMSAHAARRAAELGLGMIASSLLDDDAVAALAARYRAAGGTRPHVVILRVWLGEPPWDLVRTQMAEYRDTADATRTASADAATAATGPPSTEGLEAHDDPSVLADRIVARLRRTDADAANLRVHVAGLDPLVARDQIARIGAEVVPLVRARWTRRI